MDKAEERTMNKEKFDFNKEYAKLPKCPVCGYYLCDGAKNIKEKDNLNLNKSQQRQINEH
jgi:hypothetical protein